MKLTEKQEACYKKAHALIVREEKTEWGIVLEGCSKHVSGGWLFVVRFDSADDHKIYRIVVNPNKATENVAWSVYYIMETNFETF